MAQELKKVHKKLKIRSYIGLGFLICFLLFLWQLYRAPIALPFLKPYIIKALNHDDTDFEVTLSSVNLELVRSIKPIKIIANDVSYKNKDGSINISAPRVSVSFSMKALLKGMVAPSSIEVNSPNVYVFQTYGVEKKEVDLINEKKIESYIDDFNDFMERFNSSDKSYSESYINSIDIKNANVEFHEVELGQKFVLTDLNYSFDRNFTNIKMDFSTLLKAQDISTPIGLDLEYRPGPNKLALQFFVSEFVPLKSIGEVFGAKINAPLSGKIETLIDLNKIVENKDNFVEGLEKSISTIAFEFEGGAGNIEFVGLDDYKYKLSSLLLKGNIEGGLDKLGIKDALFDLDGQKVLVGFDATGMKKLLLNNSYEDIKLSISAGTPELSFDRLTDLWPKYISPDGWLWCKESLSGGLAKNANFRFDFGYNEKQKALGFQKLVGVVDVFDTNVYYLNGMPKVNNVYGKAYFNDDEIKINIEKGVSDGISVNGGHVRLYDLGKAHSYIDIFVLAYSSVSNALRFIDHPPLEYAKDLGLSPDIIDGFANVELGLNFELKHNIKMSDVGVKVNAELSDLIMPKAINNMDLRAQALDLKLDNSGMIIEGKTNLDNIPINLYWKEEFKNKSYKSKYKLSFMFDEALKKKLDLDYGILSEPYIVGNPVVEADITTFDNKKTSIDVNANLTNTKLDFSFLGLKKPLGVNANIKAKVDVFDNKLQAIPSFSFAKTGFNLDGKVALDAKKRLKVVDITKIVGPKTFAKAKIDVSHEPNLSFKINITGDSYNLTEFFAKSDKPQDNAQVVEEEEDWLEKTHNANIFVAVNSLWTIDDIPIKNFAGSVELRNKIGVKELHLIGNFGKSQKSTIKMDYIPRGNEFLLDIDSNNAGATLKVLGVYDNMRGGILKIEGKRGPDKKMIGHGKIRDFKLHNTPVLAKLLTVASLSGMVNMLTGEGIAFSHFDAPFESYKKVLTTHDAKASGNVMAITVNGTFNRKTEDLNFKGVIAPLSGINDLIGKIPLVGGLLRGKDGTVFAANYEILGTVEDPKIKINPFSALSPSSLKDLVGGVFGE